MLQAVGKYVIVQLPEQQEKSKGGLLLPEITIRRMQSEKFVGTIQSVGNEVEAELKTGDIVYYNPARKGPEIEYDNQKYTVMLISDIIAVDKKV